MNRRAPYGLGDQVSPADGVAPYAGLRLPGPSAVVDEARSSSSPARASAGVSEGLLDTAVSSPFEVGANVYRLGRVDTPWRYGRNEAPVSPEEAVAIIERAIQQHRTNSRLFPLLEIAARRLAGVHAGGIWVLIWLRPELQAGTAGPSSPSRRMSAAAPIASEPSPVETPVVPAQAAALRAAAAAGAPFCEECARAAAAAAAAS